MGYDYKDSKIYLIYSKTTKRGYVGSTINPLQTRLSKHITDYRGFKGLIKKRNYRTSFEIFEDGNYNIYLLENYPCKNKDYLLKREQAWIERMKKDIVIINTANPSKEKMYNFEELEYNGYIKNLINLPCEKKIKYKQNQILDFF